MEQRHKLLREMHYVVRTGRDFLEPLLSYFETNEQPLEFRSVHEIMQVGRDVWELPLRSEEEEHLQEALGPIQEGEMDFLEEEIKVAKGHRLNAQAGEQEQLPCSPPTVPPETVLAQTPAKPSEFQHLYQHQTSHQSPSDKEVLTKGDRESRERSLIASQEVMGKEDSPAVNAGQASGRVGELYGDRRESESMQVQEVIEKSEEREGQTEEEKKGNIAGMEATNPMQAVDTGLRDVQDSTPPLQSDEQAAISLITAPHEPVYAAPTGLDQPPPTNQEENGPKTGEIQSKEELLPVGNPENSPKSEDKQEVDVPGMTALPGESPSSFNSPEGAVESAVPLPSASERKAAPKTAGIEESEDVLVKTEEAKSPTVQVSTVVVDDKPLLTLSQDQGEHMDFSPPVEINEEIKQGELDGIEAEIDSGTANLPEETKEMSAPREPGAIELKENLEETGPSERPEDIQPAVVQEDSPPEAELIEEKPNPTDLEAPKTPEESKPTPTESVQAEDDRTSQVEKNSGEIVPPETPKDTQAVEMEAAEVKDDSDIEEKTGFVAPVEEMEPIDSRDAKTPEERKHTSMEAGEDQGDAGETVPPEDTTKVEKSETMKDAHPVDAEKTEFISAQKEAAATTSQVLEESEPKQPSVPPVTSPVATDTGPTVHLDTPLAPVSSGRPEEDSQPLFSTRHRVISVTRHDESPLPLTEKPPVWPEPFNLFSLISTELEPTLPTYPPQRRKEGVELDPISEKPKAGLSESEDKRQSPKQQKSVDSEKPHVSPSSTIGVVKQEIEETKGKGSEKASELKDKTESDATIIPVKTEQQASMPSDDTLRENAAKDSQAGKTLQKSAQDAPENRDLGRKTGAVPPVTEPPVASDSAKADLERIKALQKMPETVEPPSKTVLPVDLRPIDESRSVPRQRREEATVPGDTPTARVGATHSMPAPSNTGDTVLSLPLIDAAAKTKAPETASAIAAISASNAPKIPVKTGLQGSVSSDETEKSGRENAAKDSQARKPLQKSAQHAPENSDLGRKTGAVPPVTEPPAASDSAKADLERIKALQKMPVTVETIPSKTVLPVDLRPIDESRSIPRQRREEATIPGDTPTARVGATHSMPAPSKAGDTIPPLSRVPASNSLFHLPSLPSHSNSSHQSSHKSQNSQKSSVTAKPSLIQSDSLNFITEPAVLPPLFSPIEHKFTTTSSMVVKSEHSSGLMSGSVPSKPVVGSKQHAKSHKRTGLAVTGTHFRSSPSSPSKQSPQNTNSFHQTFPRAASSDKRIPESLPSTQWLKANRKHKPVLLQVSSSPGYLDSVRSSKMVHSSRPGVAWTSTDILGLPHIKPQKKLKKPRAKPPKNPYEAGWGKRVLKQFYQLKMDVEPFITLPALTVTKFDGWRPVKSQQFTRSLKEGET